MALETSPNAILSGRASSLHSILHSKHASLLNARYVVSARTAFDYQKKSGKGPICGAWASRSDHCVIAYEHPGYRLSPSPTALLHRWYSLVRDKRTTRQEFLRALVKVFDVEVSKTIQVCAFAQPESCTQANRKTQDDIDFVRYMAENFSAFEYKTQEEVLTVLKYLTSVLSTSGMQLVETLSPAHLLKQLHEPALPDGSVRHVEPVSRRTRVANPLYSNLRIPFLRRCLRKVSGSLSNL